MAYYASLSVYGRLTWYPTSNSGRGRERTLSPNKRERERVSKIKRHLEEIDKCEVCWENESNLYRYGGSVYCEQDLERAKVEGWHK